MNILTALATIATITLCGFIWGFEVARDNPPPLRIEQSHLNACYSGEIQTRLEISKGDYIAPCTTEAGERDVFMESENEK